MTQKLPREPKVDPAALARALAVDTHENVAAQFSLSRATISRKLRQAPFRQMVTDRQGEIVGELVASTLHASHGAIERLVWLSQNATSETVQASCSKTLLDVAKQWFEIGSLSAGLREVHEQLEQAKAKDDPYKIRAA